ncbi:hypothetical protein Hokovirus_3_270 [Hokovirus HKV1]|uniref:Uncharacterized protein n=1 Tax=Hokovirus HKV1 TaxID=1977638 RepID=A0A1V0SH05_9VIRU|nr:hypothetical protein Hokovirus_3_270 [Hokovirus HKV1]
MNNQIIAFLIRNYILAKTRLLVSYNYVKTCFINVESIQGIKNGKKTNLFLKYYMIYWLNMLILSLNYFSDKLTNLSYCVGNSYDKIYIRRNNYDNVENSIYEYTNEKKISLYEVIKKKVILDQIKKTKARIFTTIKLQNMDYSLKDLLIYYKDYEGEYSNTLNNILEFSNIKVSDDEQVEINYSEMRKKIHVVIPYSELKDHHINYLYNTDFLSIINNIN